MKIPHGEPPAMLGDILAESFRRAHALHAERAALYVVSLLDRRGLALAQAVREEAPGPDPAAVRDQSQRAGAIDPTIVGSASVEALARALESLDCTEPPDRHLLGWTVREIHRSGDVPVVVLLEGMALVATLETLAKEYSELPIQLWTRPPVGEA